MKKLFKLLVSLVLLALVGFSFVGCGMRGYSIACYIISSSTYSNRPVDASPEEELSYVKNASGTSSDGKHWCNNDSGLRDYFSEKCGSLSNMDSIISDINQNEVSAFWYAPGILAINKNYLFFYVENNNFK